MRGSLAIFSLIGALIALPAIAQEYAVGDRSGFPENYQSWRSVTKTCGSGDISIDIVGYRAALKNQQVSEYRKGGTVFGVFMNSPPWSTLYSIPSFNDGELGYFGPFDDESTQESARQAFRNGVSDNADTADAVFAACEETEREIGQTLFDLLLTETEAVFPDYAGWEMRERQCNDTISIRAYGTASQRVYETRLAQNDDHPVLAHTLYPAPEKLFLLKVGDAVSIHEENDALHMYIITATAAALGLEGQKDRVQELLVDCSMAMMSAGFELRDHFRKDTDALEGELEQEHLDQE